MTTLAERIRWVMQKYDLTQSELARIAGVKQPSVAGWLNGRTKSLKSEPAFEICKKFPINSDWLINGRGSELLITGTPVIALDPSELEEHPDFVHVKAYAIECSAGHGRVNYEVDEETEGKSYRLSWIQKHHLNPDKLMIITVRGESMEPLLFDGDSITVDTATTNIISGKVYVFMWNQEVRVKRLRRLMSGGVLVISDNPDWQDETLSADEAAQMTIIGRVVDRSGTGGL